MKKEDLHKNDKITAIYQEKELLKADIDNLKNEISYTKRRMEISRQAKGINKLNAEDSKILTERLLSLEKMLERIQEKYDTIDESTVFEDERVVKTSEKIDKLHNELEDAINKHKEQLEHIKDFPKGLARTLEQWREKRYKKKINKLKKKKLKVARKQRKMLLDRNRIEYLRKAKISKLESLIESSNKRINDSVETIRISREDRTLVDGFMALRAEKQMTKAKKQKKKYAEKLKKIKDKPVKAKYSQPFLVPRYRINYYRGTKGIPLPQTGKAR